MQIVVDTSIDTLSVNKSRLNMMFARKVNPLSKAYRFYCLGVMWTVLPCGCVPVTFLTASVEGSITVVCD